MDLAGVYADLKSAISRGSSYDARIPGWAAAAVRKLENNYDWNYMYCKVDVAAGTLQDVSSISTLVKKEDENGLILIDEELAETKLIQVSRNEVLSITADATPTGYWKSADGDQTVFNFDATFPSTNALRLEIWGWVYTTVPVDTAQTIWLSRNSPMLIVARTMLSLVGILRDPSIPQLWQPVFDAEIREALLADDSAKQANRSYQMKYGRDLTGEL